MGKKSSKTCIKDSKKSKKKQKKKGMSGPMAPKCGNSSKPKVGGKKCMRQGHTLSRGHKSYCCVSPRNQQFVSPKKTISEPVIQYKTISEEPCNLRSFKSTSKRLDQKQFVQCAPPRGIVPQKIYKTPSGFSIISPNNSKDVFNHICRQKKNRKVLRRIFPPKKRCTNRRKIMLCPPTKMSREKIVKFNYTIQHKIRRVNCAIKQLPKLEKKPTKTNSHHLEIRDRLQQQSEEEDDNCGAVHSFRGKL